MNPRPLIAAAVAGAAIAAGSITPANAAPQPWHVKNSVNSDQYGYIHRPGGCGPGTTYVILWPGDTADSKLWDCGTMWGTTFSVKVYDGATGNLIVTRNYQPGHWFTIYDSNDYLMTAT